jgi:hypothetical protein
LARRPSAAFAALASCVLCLLLLATPSVRAESPMAWSQPRPIDPQAPVHFSGGNDVACPTASFCVAVADFGMAVGSTAPAEGVEAWDAAHIDDAPENELTAVSCPTASFCAAVDRGGGILTSSDPLGGAGAWSRAHLDGIAHFADISCPSAAFCAAVDDQGRIASSFDPSGGAAAWQIVHADPGRELTAISCPTASFCAATDFGSPFDSDVLVSTAPGGPNWAAVGLNHHGRTEGISCPTASFCVAVSDEGTLVSAAPTAGAAAWQVSPDGAGLSDVHCPSLDFCAGSGSGTFAWLADPTASTAWEETDITPGRAALIPALSCAGADLCVAIERSGDIDVFADPDGGAGGQHPARSARQHGGARLGQTPGAAAQCHLRTSHGTAGPARRHSHDRW